MKQIFRALIFWRLYMSLRESFWFAIALHCPVTAIFYSNG